MKRSILTLLAVLLVLGVFQLSRTPPKSTTTRTGGFPAAAHHRPQAADDRNTTLPGRDTPSDAPRLSEPMASPGSSVAVKPEHIASFDSATPDGHRAWPEGRVVAVREETPLNGLVRRITLIQPADFPHPVYVEEFLNTMNAPEEDRLVRRFEAVASHLLVKLHRARTPDELASVIRQFGGTVRAHPTADRVYFVDMDRIELEGVPRAQAILSLYPELIEYAEPDAIVRAAATTPNDPRFEAEQWGLNNTGQDRGTAGFDIDAPEGWDIRSAATNIIVAVVDSGIRYTHQDLAANMWRNPGETGPDGQGGDKATNGLDDDGNGFVDDIHGINAINDTSDPADDLPDPVFGVGGHGTSVAGVIGAVGNNGIGVAGVAWKVQLMALKWFNNKGAGALSDAIECIDYARVKGASLVNASWQQGGLLSGTVNQSMMDALDRLRQDGIIFVSSAGNDSANNDLVAHYPSNYPLDNMVAVAATTRKQSLWRKSNVGERLVDIAAPGENILSPTSKADDDYSLVSGTSFAAPHVTGLLALLKAQFPAEDHRTLIDRLLAGAVRHTSLAGNVRSGAMANLFNSLSLPVVNQFPEITSFTLNGAPVASQEEVSAFQGTNVAFALAATGTPPLRYIWSKDDKVINGATTASYTIPSFAATDIGQYQVAVSNAAGVVTLGMRLLGVVQKPELAAAVNATNQTFLSSGNTLWDGQPTVTRDGVSAGASGRIAARQGTIASTLVNGPGKLSFTWKVSSERNNDTLDLLIDNVRADAISGEVDWTRKELALSAGPHEIRWRYVKDASLSKGQDKGYLDQFEYVADGKTAPTIKNQPLSQTALQGANVFFSVLADGSAPFSYQWLKDGVNLPNATSNRLDLLAVAAADEARYSVMVSNTVGSVVSANVRLTVTPTAVLPRLTTHPTSQTVDEGGTVVLSSEASGTPPLTFQWRKNGFAIRNQTNATLTLSNVTLNDSGTYSVRVSNQAGEVTSQDGIVTVVQLQLAPVITKQPVDQTLSEGGTIDLFVEADGLGPFTYEWSKDGQVLGGQAESGLKLTNAQPTDAGTYQVQVLSPFGMTPSTTALVKVTISTPTLSQAVESTNITWTTDGSAAWFSQSTVTFDGMDALQSGDIDDLGFSELTATLHGPGQLSFWWTVDSEFQFDFLDFYVDGEFWDGISGVWFWEEIIWNLPEGEHTVTWLYNKDEIVSEGADAGWVDQVSFVSFNTESPVVVYHPFDQSGMEGDQVQFEIEALGSPPLTYQWLKDGEPLPGATGLSFTIADISFDDEGGYSVTVSNQFGVTESRMAFLFIFGESDLIDYALNSPGLFWTDYDLVPWFPQIDETIDGEIAMQSGFIDDFEVAWLGTAVNGPGLLFFEWKVSSEADYDFLEFLIDDELYDAISGEVDWENYSVLIPPGLHFLDWVYSKDEILSDGADAAWLDYVEFYPLDSFSYWQELFFTPSELLDPELSGPDGDLDLDGRVNFVEYGFGLYPFWDEDPERPTASLITIAQNTFLELVYLRRNDDPNLVYEYEISSNPGDWLPSPAGDWAETVSFWDEGLEQVRARYSVPIAPGTTFFCRVTFRVGP